MKNVQMRWWWILFFSLGFLHGCNLPPTIGLEALILVERGCAECRQTIRAPGFASFSSFNSEYEAHIHLSLTGDRDVFMTIRQKPEGQLEYREHLQGEAIYRLEAPLSMDVLGPSKPAPGDRWLVRENETSIHPTQELRVLTATIVFVSEELGLR